MTATEVLGSQQRAPSEAQLRGFGLLSALYLVIAAAVVPWAAVPGPAEPEIIVVHGIAILVAELCTAALLGVLYLGSGRPALLVLACAYLYSSLMAGARVAAYPGALEPRALFGGEQTAAWLFDAWWVGMAVLVLAAVVLAAKAVPAQKERIGTWLLAGCALTVAAVAVLAFVPAATTPEMRWTAFAIYAAALALIWRKRAFGGTGRDRRDLHCCSQWSDRSGRRARGDLALDCAARRRDWLCAGGRELVRRDVRFAADWFRDADVLGEQRAVRDVLRARSRAERVRDGCCL